MTTQATFSSRSCRVCHSRATRMFRFRPARARIDARVVDTEHLAAGVVVHGALHSAQQPSLEWSG